MPEIRKGAKDSTVEGGKEGAAQNPGTVHTVKNEGTADGAGVDRSRSPRSSKHGRDKSIGR
jgi:hypothetical protein